MFGQRDALQRTSARKQSYRRRHRIVKVLMQLEQRQLQQQLVHFRERRRRFLVQHQRRVEILSLELQLTQLITCRLTTILAIVAVVAVGDITSDVVEQRTSLLDDAAHDDVLARMLQQELPIAVEIAETHAALLTALLRLAAAGVERFQALET